MRFRPCIDIHNGRVKQIVGATLREGSAPKTNFETDRPASDFAKIYRADGLSGGHIAMLGSGNESAAAGALRAYPDGLQIGGGINVDNAKYWIDQGAEAVIVTSFVFVDGSLDRERLKNLSETVGRKRLVLDLSCKRFGGAYFVMSERWQRQTDVALSSESISELAEYCSEFLIHAIDMEGLASGIDGDLVELLALESPCPVTYAGGISSFDDIDTIYERGEGRVDYTVGSALDIFGGSKLVYADLVARTAG